jgi:hypothetical protein
MSHHTFDRFREGGPVFTAPEPEDVPEPPSSLVAWLGPAQVSCWRCGARGPFLRFRARLGRVVRWECHEHGGEGPGGFSNA